MITSKETAAQLATAGERFIEALSTALFAEKPHSSQAEFDQLRRAAGIIIGTMETELLVPLYQQYPEIEPEHHKMSGNDI